MLLESYKVTPLLDFFLFIYFIQVAIISASFLNCQVDECDRSSREGTATENPVQDEQRKQICGDCEDYSSIQLHESEDYMCVRSGQDESSQGEPC